MKIIILIFTLLMSSCGLLFRRSDVVVPVDSELRGQKVFNEKNEYIGTTPFFYKINEKRNQKFSLIENDLKNEINYKCDFNFSEALGLDLFSTAVVFPYGASTFLIDWYYDKIYRCHQKIYFKNNIKNKENKPLPVVLIIPPFTDAYTSAQIIENKTLELETKMLPKFKFITLDTELQDIGISYETQNTIKKINFAKLRPLLLKNNVTHLLFYKINPNISNKLDSTPFIIDAFSKEIVYTSPENIVVEKNKIRTLDSILDKIHIIPNSFNVGYSYIFNQDNQKFNNTQHPQSFPKILTSFSIDSTYAPNQYDLWDFDLYSSTQFSAPSWETHIENYRYQFQSLHSAISGGMLFKTPIGAFLMEIGIGGIYFYQRPPEAINSFKLAISSRLSFVTYLTNKVYLKLESETINASHTYLQGIPVTVSTASISIGYFLPEFEGYLRSKL